MLKSSGFKVPQIIPWSFHQDHQTMKEKKAEEVANTEVEVKITTNKWEIKNQNLIMIAMKKKMKKIIIILRQEVGAGFPLKKKEKFWDKLWKKEIISTNKNTAEKDLEKF